MSCIYFMIPRLALSGGNVVTLSLARHLSDMGRTVAVFDGYHLHRVESVKLASRKKGLWNTVLNLFSFLGCSLFIGCRGGVATHHLTSLFGGADYTFVQDLELNFYPRNRRALIKGVWKRYLSAKKIIFTNRYLAKAVGFDIDEIGFSFDATKPVAGLSEGERDIDVLMVLREGEYKGPGRALILHSDLTKVGVRSCLVNNTSRRLSVEGVVEAGDRDYFLSLLTRAKIFVCTSDWEGLGLPNIEAFLAGCSVVSTPIPSACMLANVSGWVEVLSADQDGADVAAVQKSLSQWRELNAEEVNERCEFVQKASRLWWEYIDSVFNMVDK